jgi:tRNA modification GTPase
LLSKSNPAILAGVSERDFYPEDCIAALATPWGQSALAVIRVSGPGCLDRLSLVFSPSDGGGLAERDGHTLVHGWLHELPSGGREPVERIDEALVALFRGPRSFTGEDSAELSTHGSPVILRRALEVLLRAGFRAASPGEFTLRAFINGKMDLTQAEAVNELVRARTDRARALALSRLSGAVEETIRGIKSGLVGLLAGLEVRIDYPEEEIEGPPLDMAELDRRRDELRRLLATYRVGSLYQEGISVVLAGPTNCGKSTLFNRLLREDRAIVSEVHGTTRDYLEGFLSLRGIPVRLYDTAGFREARDEIEREGIRRTEGIVGGAQVLLYLVDCSRGVMPADREILERASPRAIPLWSKADLAAAPCPEGFVAVSGRTGEGIEELTGRIVERALSGLGAVDTDGPIIDSLRQKELLERALGALQELDRGRSEGQPFDLLAVDLKEALDALGEITGEVSSQEILDTVFSRFCVGK